MEFNIADMKPTITKEAIRMVLYGANGTGKTHFACNMPKPIIANIEGGLNGQYVTNQRIDTWAELLDFTKAVLTQKHDYKTFVIDTLTRGMKLAEGPACKANKIDDDNIKSNYSKAVNTYVQYAEYLRNLLEKLTLKGMHVVVLCQEKIMHKNDLDKEPYQQLVPSLHDQIVPIFTDSMNIVGHIFQPIITVKKDNKQSVSKVVTGSEYNCHLRVQNKFSNAIALAKNRYLITTETNKLTETYAEKTDYIPATAEALLQQYDEFGGKLKAKLEAEHKAKLAKEKENK